MWHVQAEEDLVWKRPTYIWSDSQTFEWGSRDVTRTFKGGGGAEELIAEESELGIAV